MQFPGTVVRVTNIFKKEVNFLNELDKERTIDDLGRVIVPKEIRDAIGWKTGDKLLVSCSLEDKSVTLCLAEKC